MPKIRVYRYMLVVMLCAVLLGLLVAGLLRALSVAPDSFLADLLRPGLSVTGLMLVIFALNVLMRRGRLPWLGEHIATPPTPNPALQRTATGVMPHPESKVCPRQ